MFGLSGARVGRHEVHSLGNITFISQALNGFDVGVGSEPLRLAEEPPDNLTAHLISPSLLPLYDIALGEGSSAKTAFGEFSRQREGLIGLAFRDWDAALRRTAGQRPEVSYPVSRRLSPDLSDQIRALELRQDVTDLLVSLSRMTGVKSAAAIKSVQSKLALELRVRSEAGGKRARFRLDVDTNGRLRLKLRRELAAIASAIESPVERSISEGRTILVVRTADDMLTVLGLLESQCRQLESADAPTVALGQP